MKLSSFILLQIIIMFFMENIEEKMASHSTSLAKTYLFINKFSNSIFETNLQFFYNKKKRVFKKVILVKC